MGTGRGELKSLWLTVGGLRIHARVSANRHAGSAVPVVLVHGLVVSSLYMVPTAERLAIYYPVYAPDLPGFGKSDKPSHVMNVNELADALQAWMEAAGIERAVLVGNSMGCQVIVDLAARKPQWVEALVLLGPTADPCARTLGEQFKRLLIDAPGERLSILFAELLGLYQAGLKRSWRTAKYAIEDRIEDKLPEVHAPTLVIRGGRDPVVPEAWADEVTRLLPRGRLAIIPHGPHGLNYSTPDEVVLLVREFIDREVSAPAAIGS